MKEVRLVVVGAEPTLLTLLSMPGTSFSFSAACCSLRFRSWNMSWCRFRVCMIFCGLGARSPEPGWTSTATPLSHLLLVPGL